jgi:gamma-glutamyl hercynylcysteine S-oxide synthase
MNKKREEKPDIVKLKPVSGIAPGLYLTIIYSIIAVIILFLVLLLPGIVKNGSKVTFITAVPESSAVSPLGTGAAVYQDSTYLGSGNFTVFLKKGTYTFRFEKPGYISEEMNISIGGRIMFSLFFPKKATVEKKMKLASLDEYLSLRIKDLYAWSFITEYSQSYFYPEHFSALAQDIAAADLDGDQLERVERFYQHTAALISSDAMFRDYQKGAEVLNAAYSSSNKTVFTNPEHLGLLNSYYGSRISDSQEILTDMPERISPNSDIFDAAVSLKLLGVNYASVAGGAYTAGRTGTELPGKLDEYPVYHEVEDFFISVREVSERDFAYFINENPYWSSTNSDVLIESNLVDDFYLNGIDLDNPKDFPVRNISWHAAAAYCSWLTEKIAAENSDYQSLMATLPTGAQWEYAAAASDAAFTTALSVAPAFALKPVHLLGNVWEYTSETYLPTGKALFHNIDSELRDVDTEKVVRGGSWANEALPDILYSYGSAAPYSCSEFIGFRPVLVYKE